jgi:hypothetical protein
MEIFLADEVGPENQGGRNGTVDGFGEWLQDLLRTIVSNFQTDLFHQPLSFGANLVVDDSMKCSFSHSFAGDISQCIGFWNLGIASATSSQECFISARSAIFRKFHIV